MSEQTYELPDDLTADYAAWVAGLRSNGTVTLPGAAVLDDVERFVRRFCVLPSEHAYVAVTLWAAHTHFLDLFETTGRLACLSPEPGSGKTRVLEVLEMVCANSLLALDLSMAAFFRIVEDNRPTILLDEVDAIFTGKAKSEGTEDMRRVINNGYRTGAVVQRVGGQNRDQVQSFRVFTPVAMAGLGNLPDTLMSRSIIIRMKRRGPGERVEPFRERLHRPEGEAIRDRMAAWADCVQNWEYPTLPDGVVDRDADVWEPLVMVADLAGGAWPERARNACVRFIEEKPESSVSLGVRLLTDLQRIWADEVGSMSTSELIDALAGLDEAPWADLYGEGLKPRKLAQLLSDYGIGSTSIRTRTGDVRRGYRREDLWDAWQRYTPHLSDRSATSATATTSADSGEREAGTEALVADVAELPETCPVCSTCGTQLGSVDIAAGNGTCGTCELGGGDLA